MCSLLLQLQRGLSVCVSVCLLVMTVSPTKTAEPIEMPCGLWTRVGPRNHVLRGGARSSKGKGNLEGCVVPPLHIYYNV